MATLTVVVIWVLLIAILYAVGGPDRFSGDTSDRDSPSAEKTPTPVPTVSPEQRRSELERAFPWEYLPADEPTQNRLLTALRRSFLLVELDDYQFFLGKCRCPVPEMPAREGFFRRLGMMLARHLRFAPAITQYPVLREIALEMASCGSPILKTSSEDVLARYREMEKLLISCRDPIRIKEPSRLSHIPEFAGTATEARPGLKQWINQVDRDWGLVGRLDAFTAFLAEALEEVQIGEMKFAALNLQMLKGFFEDLRQGLVDQGAQEWLDFLDGGRATWLREISPVISELMELAEFSTDLTARIDRMCQFLANRSYSPKEMEEMLFLLSRHQEFSEVGKLICDRVKVCPEEAFHLRLLGEWLLFSQQPMAAIVVFAWGANIYPEHFDIILGLARSYQKLYLTEQVDICLNRLAIIDRERCGHLLAQGVFQGEVLFRSKDGAGVEAFLDGNRVGICPVNVQGVPLGRHRVVCRLPGREAVEGEFDVTDGGLYLVNHSVVAGELVIEPVGDGMETLLSAGDADRLRGLLRDYLISDLGNLPRPSFPDLCRLFLETRESMS